MRDIYRDMAERTGGDIYIAVAGPVRTGKSTFIKRFSELLLLPNMENDFEKERLVDELPQSGAGRSIMTTQPRFVPAEAVNVSFEEGVSCRCKLIDCVGYMVPGAVGDREGEGPRMVTTPWFDHDIPFSQAAEVGTTRVIQEHATISIVMTTDGSITDLPRDSYEEAERQAIEAARAANKPFVVVVNSTGPEGEPAQALARDIGSRYGVTAVPLDVKNMSGAEVRELITPGADHPDPVRLPCETGGNQRARVPAGPVGGKPPHGGRSLPAQGAVAPGADRGRLRQAGGGHAVLGALQKGGMGRRRSGHWHSDTGFDAGGKHVLYPAQRGDRG